MSRTLRGIVFTSCMHEVHLNEMSAEMGVMGESREMGDTDG